MILIPNGRLYVLQRTYLISSFGKFWITSLYLPGHIFVEPTAKFSVCEISGRKVSKSSQT